MQALFLNLWGQFVRFLKVGCFVPLVIFFLAGFLCSSAPEIFWLPCKQITGMARKGFTNEPHFANVMNLNIICSSHLDPLLGDGSWLLICWSFEPSSSGMVFAPCSSLTNCTVMLLLVLTSKLISAFMKTIRSFKWFFLWDKPNLYLTSPHLVCMEIDLKTPQISVKNATKNTSNYFLLTP